MGHLSLSKIGGDILIPVPDSYDQNIILKQLELIIISWRFTALLTRFNINIV